jgi:hypothetical protein
MDIADSIPLLDLKGLTNFLSGAPPGARRRVGERLVAAGYKGIFRFFGSYFNDIPDHGCRHDCFFAPLWQSVPDEWYPDSPSKFDVARGRESLDINVLNIYEADRRCSHCVRLVKDYLTSGGATGLGINVLRHDGFDIT